VVVDDVASGITRVVRGRDIAPSTATHVLLQRALGLPTPSYRHHFLLLEEPREARETARAVGLGLDGLRRRIVCTFPRSSRA
jgi:glutamyl/glutaminyl-tRNA synthetase